MITSPLDTMSTNNAEAVPSERLDALRDRLHAPLETFWRKLGWGCYGDGLLTLCDPAELDGTLAEWLGGESPSRIPLGYGALGHLLYYRDLRERAKSLGMSAEQAEVACDFSILDVHYKRIDMVATSPDMMLAMLNDEEWLVDALGKDLFDEARGRLGPPERGEIYGFVPALALGGSRDAASLQKQRADVHWSLLLQL